MNITELLSPAGNYECFLAAMKAGADAVYLGASHYGARAYAGNFSEEELLKALDYAHLHDKKIYLTVNTVMKNKELNGLYDFILPFYRNGLDGVIVQDLGVIRFFRKTFPRLNVHTSTQMAVSGTEGIRLLQEFGITRAVLARELTLKEIAAIKRETGVELECFVHGAMCYCYSGKCLFSSFLGNRSGNRGRCAGPCRLPFNNKYPLSMKDMCTIELLPELIAAGIDSLKIEGRMKAPGYVAGVTGIYRYYLDRVNEGAFSVAEKDYKELLRLYTRSGNCTGYYKEYNGRNMITMDKPSYESADDDTMTASYAKYTADSGKIPLRADVSVFAGCPVALTLSGEGTAVTVSGAEPLPAERQPITETTIIKQLNKFGDTPYELSSTEIALGDGLFLPVRDLNELRRSAVEAYTEAKLAPFRRPDPTPATLKENPIVKTTGKPLIHCMIADLCQLPPLITRREVNIISVPVQSAPSFNELRTLSDKIRGKGKSFYACLPYVIRKDYFKRARYLAEAIKAELFDGIVIDNYESLWYLRRELKYSGAILADIHLYSLNNSAYHAYTEQGVDTVSVPIELTRAEASELIPGSYDCIVYGNIPLMVSAQCLNKTLNSCTHKPGLHKIIDRKGTTFYYRNECGECVNTIYNSVPLFLEREDAAGIGIGIRSLRLMFTVEDAKGTAAALDSWLNGRKPQAFTRGHRTRPVE